MSDLFMLVKRQKWLIVAAVVVVPAVAVLVTLRAPTSYRGTATVLIADIDRVSFQYERAMITELELVKNPAFAVQAVEQLHLSKSPAQVLAGVNASVVNHSAVLAITATGDSPKQAADIANAVADGYVRWYNGMRSDQLKAQADAAQAQMEELARSVVASTSASPTTVAAKPGTEAFVDLVARNVALRAATEKYNELRIEQKSVLKSVTVVTRATPVDRPVDKGTLRNGLLGLVMGAMLGLSAAVVAERFGKQREGQGDGE